MGRNYHFCTIFVLAKAVISGAPLPNLIGRCRLGRKPQSHGRLTAVLTSHASRARGFEGRIIGRRWPSVVAAL
jgi:hypothetical protein